MEKFLTVILNAFAKRILLDIDLLKLVETLKYWQSINVFQVIILKTKLLQWWLVDKQLLKLTITQLIRPQLQYRNLNLRQVIQRLQSTLTQVQLIQVRTLFKQRFHSWRKNTTLNITQIQICQLIKWFYCCHSTLYCLDYRMLHDGGKFIRQRQYIKF